MGFREKERERIKAWYEKNKEAISERRKKKRIENSGSIREYHRTYYANNKEKLAEYKRQWRIDNIEKVKVREAASREANPDRDKNYYWKNREAILAQQLKRRQENPERYKWNRIKCAYGITKDEWMTLFARQGHRCGICEAIEPGGKQGWHTDHCHITGLVRGILCWHCNSAIGKFRDSAATIRRAAEYVENFGVTQKSNGDVKMDVDFGLRVRQSIELRKRIKEIEDRQKEELAPLKSALERLCILMHKWLDETGQDNAKTEFGTVYKKSVKSATLEDSAAFMAYVRNHEAWDLIDVRANKTAISDFVDVNHEAPPGVKYSVMTDVGIRAATPK